MSGETSQRDASMFLHGVVLGVLIGVLIVGLVMSYV